MLFSKITIYPNGKLQKVLSYQIWLFWVYRLLTLHFWIHLWRSGRHVFYFLPYTMNVSLIDYSFYCLQQYPILVWILDTMPQLLQDPGWLSGISHDHHSTSIFSEYMYVLNVSALGTQEYDINKNYYLSTNNKYSINRHKNIVDICF